MKNRELRLICELIKNSRRSDRGLAKIIGCSQPTVTRMRRKMEKEGYIKEYTMIPDLAKLGYSIMAFTFTRIRRLRSLEQVEKGREEMRKRLLDAKEVVMGERGTGFGHHSVYVSIHKDYSSYLKFKEWIKGATHVEIKEIKSFLVDLNDEVKYLPLTFSKLAEHLLPTTESQFSSV